MPRSKYIPASERRPKVVQTDGWTCVVQPGSPTRLSFHAPPASGEQSGKLMGTAQWDKENRVIRYLRGCEGHAVPGTIAIKFENLLRKASK